MGYLRYMFVAFLLWSGFVKAQQNTVRGIIRDNQGPLEFVTVSIQGTPIGTISDDRGFFEIKNITDGKITIHFSHVGYLKESKELTFKNNTTANVEIQLQPVLNELEEMVVTGTRTEKDRNLSPVNVSILDSRILENTQSNSIAEGLNFQPGLRVEVDCQTCNYTQLRMNGLGGSYTQLLINNRPVFSSLMGLYGLEMISTGMIEKIEVIRGSGSALYGSNAIAGTVNIITKEPEEDNVIVGMQGAIVGNQTPEINYDGQITKVFPNGGITIFSSGRARDVYDHNGDGFSELPKINGVAIGAKAFIKTGKYSKLNLDVLNVREYRRGGNKNDLPAHQTDQSEERDHNIYVTGADYSISFPNLRSSLNAFLSAQHTTRDHYTGIDGVDGYGTTRNYTYNTGFQWNYYLSHTTFTLGLDYKNDYVFDQIPYYQYLIDQTSRQLGLFGQMDWMLSDKMSVIAGIRADQHNLINHLVFNPRVNLRYKLFDELQLRAGYGTGFRAPQAFDTDLHIAFAGGGISYIRLDPDLKMERSESFTGSISWDKPSRDYIYGFTIEGFYNRLDDAFILEQTGTDNQGNIILEKRNGAGSDVYGITLESRMNYKYIIEFSGGYTLQESYFDHPVTWSENVRGIRDYLRTPDHYGYYLVNISPLDQFHINLSGTLTGPMLVPHFGGAPGVPEDRMETSRLFWNNNIKIVRDINLKQNQLEVYGGIRNTWNSYQNDFDIGKNRDSNYVYGPATPRSYFIGVKFNSL